MTWLRHAGRHVQHTCANYLKANLDDLGWTAEDVADRPWGGTRVVLWTSPAVTEDGPVDEIAPGVVAITLGDEAYPEMLEMGGPLAEQDYPLFVDCFHDTEETTLALASDVRDIFMGRLPGTQRFLPVVNQADQVAVPGWRMEFEDVERVKPDRHLQLHWQVVKVTAVTDFPEVTY